MHSMIYTGPTIKHYFRRVEQYLTIWDIFLSPIYLGLLIFLAIRHRDRKYPPGHPLRPYYLKGLYAKFGGAIFIALIYQFYYGSGDTFNFFHDSRIINSSLNDSFDIWTKLLLRRSPNEYPELYSYTSQMNFYNDPASYSVSAIGAVLGLLSGTTYLPMAFLFAFVAYTGIWAMYKTFAGLYPGLIKELAIAFLFIPSTIVWGSAIFKDTICMFALGWMINCTFRLFINKDFSLKNMVLLTLGFYLIAIIKIYILLGFLPALCLWLLMNYSHKISSVGVRWIVNLLSMALIAIAFLFFANKFSEELNRYSLEKVAQTAASTRGWITYASGDEGSAYSLGEFSPTIEGMLSKFPAAVAVSLFRPFIWEAKKPVMVLSALEALIFLYLTLRVIVSLRGKLFSFLAKDPNLLFCLVFSIIFAFAVGISSYNFGALSRYKIPCLPFFGAFIMICLHGSKMAALNTKLNFESISTRKVSRSIRYR